MTPSFERSWSECSHPFMGLLINLELLSSIDAILEGGTKLGDGVDLTGSGVERGTW
jgi:hypothetical protein